ncbi:glycosyl transferase family 90 [Frigoriflavimonas asaccharolytica]|uniref:Glycosyl transferase CAP10 domain-containing protein n=1 Tax=Frigoriflavimonas asaccharolytica TaxID=2735899 RepID=A0A8J8G9Z8_9FLAO|nr:glycosyl transferase family 90 [Frigoriflavimonas asaccharolytica]NRS93636.1 hypothetical protein [Frigoriflavimonas asaccharolytica]
MARIFKQNKFLFYVKGYSQRFLSGKNVEVEIKNLSKNLSQKQKQEVDFRVDYYNKISEKIEFSDAKHTVSDLLHPKTPKAYYFDTYEFAKYFPKNWVIDYEFGDVNSILKRPAICKSRPIFGNNENNILLNLDKARHFVTVKDELKFSDKKDILIGRAAIHQQHRMVFYQKYFGSKFCDLGQVNIIGGNPDWIKPKISICEHLKNKFILSLEGNDVATNLKWIMSSNSIAVSPPLKMETWYMEGTLKPDEHYIGLSENYDNLEEQIQYYLDHPKECLEIIENANRYRGKFNNENIEKLISLLVLKKYFNYIH